MDCQELQSSQCQVKHDVHSNEFMALLQRGQVGRLCTVSSGFQPEAKGTKMRQWLWEVAQHGAANGSGLQGCSGVQIQRGQVGTLCTVSSGFQHEAEGTKMGQWL